MNNQLARLIAKKQKLDNFQPLPPEMVKNLNEWYRVELTYTSNAIEGNTLTRQETALVTEKGISVEGKSIEELLEATNHSQALDFIKILQSKKRQDITEQDILKIHQIILQHIDDDNAGRYRTVAVRIAGANVILPNAKKVPELMDELINWLESGNSDHPVKIAADAHFKLVSIHPFVDGNGRVARLLMDLLLLQAGYPAALIRKEDRLVYINAIEKAQLTGDLSDYYQIIYEALDRSLDIYLDSVKPKEGKLLKIGELARKTGETTSTLRFWTKEGLLQAAGYTEGNYQLYDPVMIDRIKKIRKLQIEERLTIPEIKQQLGLGAVSA